MATAGSIVIDLVMRTGLFDTDTARAEKRLKELQKTAKQVGVALGTAFVAAGTALTVLTKQAIDNADAMRDMSIRLGTSTETLSAFGYAASQTGTDIDTLGKGMKVLAKNVADSLNPTSEQSKVFDALGIKVTDAAGRLKDLSVLVPEIADKFNDLRDGTTKAALAQALFGRTGLDLTEFLNSGSQGLNEFTQRARELGIVIGQDTANAADEFNDKLGDAKALVGGLGLALAQELLPDLNRMIGGFTEGSGAGDKLADTAKTIADAMRAVGDVVQFVAVYIKAFGDVIEGAAESMAGMYQIATGLVGLDWARIKAGVSSVGEGSSLFFLGSDATDGTKPGAPPQVLFSGQDQAPAGMFKRPAAEVVARKDADDLEKKIAQALSNPTVNKASDDRVKAKKEVTEAEKEHLKIMEDIAAFEELSADTQRELTNDRLANDERLSENVKDLLADIEYENELLGKTREQQELLTAARYLGAAAATEEGKAALDALAAQLEAGKAMQDQIGAMDAVRDAGRGLFEDLMSGSKSFKDSFTDALDTIVDRINQIVAEKLIEQLFGQQGSSGGGTWGDALGAIFGAFAGAKAGGGDVFGGRPILVGEQGPEMFVPRTNGTVLTAGQTSQATGGGGGGVNQTNNFAFSAPTSTKTQSQMASRVGFELRRAQRFGT